MKARRTKHSCAPWSFSLHDCQRQGFRRLARRPYSRFSLWSRCRCASWVMTQTVRRCFHNEDERRVRLLLRKLGAAEHVCYTSCILPAESKRYHWMILFRLHLCSMLVSNVSKLIKRMLPILLPVAILSTENANDTTGRRWWKINSVAHC